MAWKEEWHVWQAKTADLSPLFPRGLTFLRLYCTSLLMYRTRKIVLVLPNKEDGVKMIEHMFGKMLFKLYVVCMEKIIIRREI